MNTKNQEAEAVRRFLDRYVEETMSLRETVSQEHYKRSINAVRKLEPQVIDTAKDAENVDETSPVDGDTVDVDEIIGELQGKIRRANLATQARKYILEQGMYDASDVQELREDKWEKPSEVLLDLADRRRLIALRPSGKGKYLYPAFQFTKKGDVVEAVALVNPIIGAGRNTWSKASWWFRGNRFLPKSVKPADFLSTLQGSDVEPTALITAANFEADPFQEGNW